MQLLAEVRNSNRLGRDIDSLLITRRELTERIDRIQSEHVEELRKRLERSKRNY